MGKLSKTARASGATGAAKKTGPARSRARFQTRRRAPRPGCAPDLIQLGPTHPRVEGTGKHRHTVLALSTRNRKMASRCESAYALAEAKVAARAELDRAASAVHRAAISGEATS